MENYAKLTENMFQKAAILYFNVYNMSEQIDNHFCKHKIGQKL